MLELFAAVFLCFRVVFVLVFVTSQRVNPVLYHSVKSVRTVRCLYFSSVSWFCDKTKTRATIEGIPFFGEFFS